MSGCVFEAADIGSMWEGGSINRMESSSVNNRWRSWSDILGKFQIADIRLRISKLASAARPNSHTSTSEPLMAIGARLGHSIASLLSSFKVVGFDGSGNIGRGLEQFLGTFGIIFVVCEFEAFTADDVGDGGY